jgi:hypothetical protein
VRGESVSRKRTEIIRCERPGRGRQHFFYIP